VIHDESHVSAGGLLGVTQLGLDFCKNSAFCRAECIVEPELNRAMDHFEYTRGIIRDLGWVEAPSYYF